MILRRRAFSLIELLWAMGLLALLAGLAFVGAGKPSSATSRSLADVVAAELVTARGLARSQQVPVAVRLHCQNGPIANALSLWRGDHQPRCIKNLNLAAELPRGQIFWGVWGSSSTPTLDRPALAGSTPFSVRDWFAPQAVPADPMVVFTPDGMAWSNDLPLIQGAYRLVACTGAESSNANPIGSTVVDPRPAYFSLTAVQQPNTISIELQGAVHVDGGVLGQDGSVAVRACHSQPPAFAQRLSVPANSTPVVTSLKLSPEAPSSLPPGVQAQVSREGHVVLSVQAQDADGDALLCEFTASGGGFTNSGSNKMQWDPADQLWKASWVFRPNPADATSTRYQIDCHVKDERGTPAVAAVGVQLTAQLELVVLDRLVYGRIPYEELYSMNSDGSDRRVLQVMKAIRGPADFPSISPDGSKILFTNERTLDLWVVNVDGSGARQLTSGRGCYGANWSPDGSKILFAAEFGGAAHLYLMPASGELNPPLSGSPLLPPRQLAAPVEIPWCQPGFNRTGDKIVTLAKPPGSALIGLYVFNLTTNSGAFLGAPETQGPTAGYGNPSFCPDPANQDLIAFDYGSGGGRQLQLIRVHGRGRTSLAAGGGVTFVSTPVWSPTGQRLAFLTDRICVGDFAAGRLNNEKQLLDLAGAFDW